MTQPIEPKSFAQKIRPAGSLKDAATRLIDLVGGAPRAADFVRVSKTQLARYSDPGETETHMPVDVVMTLEAVTGQPVISQYLAAQAGHALIAPPLTEGGDVWRLTPETLRKATEVIATIMEAEADNCITHKEAGDVVAAIDQLLGPLMALRTEFQTIGEA